MHTYWQENSSRPYASSTNLGCFASKPNAGNTDSMGIFNILFDAKPFANNHKELIAFSVEHPCWVLRQIKTTNFTGQDNCIFGWGWGLDIKYKVYIGKVKPYVQIEANAQSCFMSNSKGWKIWTNTHHQAIALNFRT